MICRRKQCFLIKQRASADSLSITIIEAVLEYHFGSLRALTKLPQKRIEKLQRTVASRRGLLISQKMLIPSWFSLALKLTVSAFMHDDHIVEMAVMVVGVPY